MSDQTFVVGSLVFRDGTPEKTKFKTLEDLTTAIEVELSDIRYDIVSGKWEFQNVNWASGVKVIGIKVFLEEWRGYLKQFTCSLHHLTDPEELNYQEESRKKED